MTGSTTDTRNLADISNLELAQILLQRLTIGDKDWHRLKSNRKARATEQAVAALVFLLKEQPQEALERFQQTCGWLDRSISAPPCPTHGREGQGRKLTEGKSDLADDNIFGDR